MRSDHLHRHKDALSLLNDEIKAELEARQMMKQRQEAKLKKIEEIPSKTQICFN